MKVKEVMSRDIGEVSADAPLAEALQRVERQPGGVVAVYHEGHLLGTLSEHDIAAWQAQHGYDLSRARARDVMRTSRAYVSEDQDVGEVARLMKQEHLPGVVVVSGDQPVGTVSLEDLATTVTTAEQTTGGMPARVFLQPIAAPSVLGLFGLASAIFVIGAYMAGWYGGSTTPEYIFPFVALFGGLAQFLAGMWAYRARDALATAIHGTWGAFALAYGLLYLLVANHTLALGAVEPGYGFWFIPLAAITFVCALAALATNGALALQQLALAVASVIAAVSLLIGSGNWAKGSGYVFMLAAILAWYAGSALLFEGTFRRVLLPLARMNMAAANRLGTIISRPVEHRMGEPGVRAGQ